jgi:hypothetical protein
MRRSSEAPAVGLEPLSAWTTACHRSKKANVSDASDHLGKWRPH